MPVRFKTKKHPIQMELQIAQHAALESVNDSWNTHLVENFVADGIIPKVKEQLQALLDKGGPDRRDYKMLDQAMAGLYEGLKRGWVSQQEIDELKELFNDAFLNATIQGYGFLKPMGYAGDFLMIDKIYTHHHTKLKQFEKWDRYFHYCEATEAVRNRKEYFKKLMLQKLGACKGTLQLLDVASGPARDVHELYNKIDAQTLATTCVDLDARAIDYASNLCREHAGYIEFYNKNILRFSTDKKFDVIWSAGLFDYFEDRIFVMAIKKFVSWLKPGGEIVIGNFSKDNSSRAYMEMFGEWMLIHRSPEELIRLAILAGANPETIQVEQEPLGVNLFLRITA
jgi:extracellular factor (EF) 3-hydroxypalmitic acid methyl ester biosynthesis protein